MQWQNIVELSNGVYWVGIRDWNRRMFDALVPLPQGTTYNSYLVKGKEKTGLIDTANPGFEKELEQKISKITNLADIDYLIMNHAEPDHAGAIPYVFERNSKVKLVATARGVKMAKTFYKVPEDRMMAVSDGNMLDLGDKTLRFIEAPMLHWPETMFTYVPENKILFPCDFFGSHVAHGLYDDEVDDLVLMAQRYYGEIMMPFSYNASKALEKIKDLPISLIAPSHGPIHRNPQRIMNSYRRWANGETKQKAVVVYVSMWNSTEKMVQVIADTLASEGIEVVTHNIAVADIADIAKDLVDSRAIVFGASTVLGGAHPLAVYAAYLVKALKPPTKYAVLMGSYGWSGGAVKQIQDLLSGTKIEAIAAMEINGPPTETDVNKIVQAGKALASKIKQS